LKIKIWALKKELSTEEKYDIYFKINFSLHVYYNIVFLVNKALAESVYVKSSLLIRHLLNDFLEVKNKKLKN
jgi:hypothetical protein